MSPLVWDLAHVGNYEDIWLLRSLGAEGVGARYDDLYDAFRHPRRDRRSLELLGPAEARAYIASVRARVLDVLERVPFDSERPLVAGGFVYGMVVQHEQQHDETMLATLQLMDGGCDRPTAVPTPDGAAVAPAEVLVPGGTFVMGTDGDPWAYDNERPAHEVVRGPVLDRHGAGEERGVPRVRRVRRVRRASLVDDRRAGPGACGKASSIPQFWRREAAGSWSTRRFGRREPRAARPARRACLLVRGRRVRTVGRPAAAHRGGMGEGRVLGSGAWPQAPLPLGRRRTRPAAAPISGSGISVRRRRARIPTAPAPTAARS